MDDYSHLRKESEEGEEKALLNADINPHERRELLERMKMISGLISDVILIVLI